MCVCVCIQNIYESDGVCRIVTSVENIYVILSIGMNRLLRLNESLTNES